MARTPTPLMTKTFAVYGRGPFPIDMLRYDRCWPASEEESAKINRTFQRGPRAHIVIRLAFHPRLTATMGRWESFGYRVLSEAEFVDLTQSERSA